MTKREDRITTGEMRSAGVRGVLVCCRRCGHAETVSADEWPSDIRLSELDGRYVCSACGQRGADITPDWESRARRP